MTAPRSTVRSRRRSASGDPSTADIHEAMRTAGKDQDAWEAIRPHVVRVLAAKTKDVQQAARIFAAYRRRPDLIPMPPPKLLPASSND
jgi:hypothetical protein